MQFFIDSLGLITDFEEAYGIFLAKKVRSKESILAGLQQNIVLDDPDMALAFDSMENPIEYFRNSLEKDDEEIAQLFQFNLDLSENEVMEIDI